MMMDFTKLYQQANKQHAIQGKVQMSMSKILPLLSKEQLSNLASMYEVPGRSKMNKGELASVLPRYILTLFNLDEALLLTNDKEFELYLELLKRPYWQNDGVTPATYLFLQARGFLFTFYDQEKLVLVIPEEVKTLHQELDWETLTDVRAYQQSVLQYVNAAVNLYGICKPETVLEIYHSQNDDQLSLEYFEEICSFHMERGQTFNWVADYLANDYFNSEQDTEFKELLRNIQSKPRYIPKKEQFLQYADDHYFEQTPQLMQLKLYISNQLCKDPEMAEYIVDDIQLECSMEAPMQDIIHVLERRNIVFDTMDQARRFVQLVTELKNNTRLWSNCGYTPVELSAISGRPIAGSVSMDQASTAKIGRNDPCPCGSGLKHKKCCGKS